MTVTDWQMLCCRRLPGFSLQLPDYFRSGDDIGNSVRPWPVLNISVRGKAWTSCAVVAAVAFLLLFLLVYQITPIETDTTIDMGFVRSPTVNCSHLGLKGKKLVVEGQHYHKFPSDWINNTCQSKYQQHCFRKNTGPKHFPPPKFLSVLRDYEAYHERCTRGYNITALGIQGDVPEGCKYLVWKAMDGMGNQLLSLVCAFTYSLLTNRAMLIATDSHIERYICDPFPLSTWVLPEDFPEPRLRTSAKRVVTYLDETFQTLRLNNSRDTTDTADLASIISHAPKHLQVYIICCDAGRDHQFFCPTAQKLFSGVNWIFYHSHEYTLPAFYFVPEFRQKLHDWFPHHDGFMHASRYLLNPQNRIWEWISQFYKSHMDGVGKQIGIQARSWPWKSNYDPSISRQIFRCAIEQKLLPKPLEDQETVATPNKTMSVEHQQIMRPDISVLVASLRAEYRDNLALQYANHTNEDGSDVNVVTASNEGRQKTGDAAHDEAAITDIWMLSFMQDLVTTPSSTFGSTASGLAGITPLLFNNYGEDKVNEPACERTNAGGPCFIVYPRNQPCDLDPPNSSIVDPANMVPEVKYCSSNSGLGIEST